MNEIVTKRNVPTTFVIDFGFQFLPFPAGAYVV